MTTTTNTTPDVSVVVRAAAVVLAFEHTPAVRNEYGACVEAGFSVNPGPDGRARVHHQLPNLNLLDPNRMSNQARWAECRARVTEYAATLRAGGWTVKEKTVTTGAILLASPPPTADQAHETLWQAINLLRAEGQMALPMPVAGPVADMLEAVIAEEHAPRAQEEPSNCYGCGGTGERYDGTGPEGHSWSGVACCCSHPHCTTCRECGAFPCEAVRNALAVALGVLALAATLTA
jgi:hypothetical protein